MSKWNRIEYRIQCLLLFKIDVVSNSILKILQSTWFRNRIDYRRIEFDTIPTLKTTGPGHDFDIRYDSISTLNDRARFILYDLGNRYIDTQHLWTPPVA